LEEQDTENLPKMAESGKVMAGLTVKSLKKHPSLVPLLAAVGLGAVGATYYLARLSQNTDTSWNKKTNPYPWQNTAFNEQRKFYAARHDYKDLKKPEGRPDI